MFAIGTVNIAIVVDAIALPCLFEGYKTPRSPKIPLLPPSLCLFVRVLWKPIAGKFESTKPTENRPQKNLGPWIAASMSRIPNLKHHHRLKEFQRFQVARNQSR